MVAAGVLCLVRMHIVCMAGVKAWAMVEVLSAAVILEECTHPPVMVVVTCLGDQMLVVALTHLCTLVVVWAVAVTLVVGVVLVHTTDVSRIVFILFLFMLYSWKCNNNL